MPKLAAADRLARQHQRDLATIAGATTSVVASAALGADPAAISTWFFGAIDGLMARIQVGHAQARRSGIDYLRRDAAMHGVDLTPVPASLDMGRVRTSMRVTGPVAFKTAIASGASEAQALASMRTQMVGSSQRLVMAGDRDTFHQTLIGGRGIKGWRRRLGGKGCGFCAMLASRGAVYVSRQAATVAKDGLRYHDHCHCYAEPLYAHEDEPADVRRLQRQWQRVTSGERGVDKAKVWRDHWENEATPRGRAREGIAERQTARVEQVFGEVHGRLAEMGIPPVRPIERRLAAGSGALGTGPAPVIKIRPVLAKAKTPQDLRVAMRAEIQRLGGRDVLIQFPPDMSMATYREQFEGLLLGYERFPDVAIREISYSVGVHEYASMGSGRLTFAAEYSSVAGRAKYLRSLRGDVQDWEKPFHNAWSTRGDGTPTSVALHEFGHALDVDTLGERIHVEVLLRQDALAQAARAPHPDIFTAREISTYAAKNTDEMIAEAFADVMLRGDQASLLSRRIVEVLEREYAAGGFRAVGGTIARFPAAPSQALSKLTVPQLRALAHERGVAVPAGARKADIVRLLDETPVKATKAVKAVAPKVSPQTVAQLRATAVQRGIPVPAKATKAELQRLVALPDAEVKALQVQAKAAAVAERAALIESRTATANLLAEVDELVSQGASKATILARLTGTDEVTAALRAAVQTGDPAKLRAALSKAGTKVKVKPISRAGAKVKYDADTMEVVGGGKIPAGAQVTVVTRGSSLTLPDGSVVQVAKAKVRAVPVKAARMPAPIAKRNPGATASQRELYDRSTQPLTGEIRSAGDGYHARTEIEPTADGPFVRKTFERREVRGLKESADAEELAPLVAHAVGIETPTVVRTADNEIIMSFIDDAMPATDFVTWEGPAAGIIPREIVDSPQGRLMGLFDLLANNNDRNAGSWFLRGDGSLVAIDHGYAWTRGQVPMMMVRFNDYFSGYLRQTMDDVGSNGLARADMLAIKKRLVALRPQFVRLGHEDWYREMMESMDQVVKWAR